MSTPQAVRAAVAASLSALPAPLLAAGSASAATDRERLPRIALRALVAAAALLAPAAANAAVSPPPPSGAAPVGFERRTLTDHQRTERLTVPRGGPRKVPLRVWYPASAPGSRPAAVFTPVEQQLHETANGLAPGALDGIGAPATEGAPAAPGKHPVILLSHGGGTSAAYHASQATDLASHGYVVVGIDHPGDSLGVDDGHGHVLGMDPGAKSEGPAVGLRPYPIRVADMLFVLGRLKTLHGAGRLDLARIGAYGHSAGGAATAGAMVRDRRIDAGAAFEGSVHELVVGAVRTGRLDRPFGYVAGASFQAPQLKLALDRFRRELRGPRPFASFPTTGHNGFTDEVWLVPQLHVDPAAAEIGTVDPAVAVRRQRTWLKGFFDRYVRGGGDPPRGVVPAHALVEITSRAGVDRRARKA